MAERDVTIKTEVEGGKESADEFGKIRDSAGAVEESLDKAGSEAKDFGTQVEDAGSKARKSLGDTAKESTGAADGLGKVGKSADDAGKTATKALGDVSSTAKDAGASAEQLDKALDLKSLPEIQMVRAELEKLGPAGKEGLDLLDKGLEAIEQSGGDVESQLVALVQEAHGFGKAGETASDQARKGLESVREKVSDVDKSLRDHTKSIDGMAAEYAHLPAPVNQAFTSVEKAVEKFENKVKSGAAVSRRDIEQIWQAQATLKNEIEASGMSMEQFGAAGQQRLKQVEDAGVRATKQFRSLRDAVVANDAQLQSSYKNFTSINNALQSMGGHIGTIATNAALMGSALTAGFALGSKAAKFFQTDMEASEGWLEGFSLRGKIFFAALADSIVSGTQVIGAAWDSLRTRSLDPLREDMKRHAEEMEESSKTMRMAWTTDREALREYALSIGTTHTALDGLRAAREKSTEATEDSTAAEEAARAATEAHRKEIEALEKKLADLRAEHESATDSLTDNTIAMGQAGQVAGAASARVLELQSRYDETRKELDRLTSSVGANNFRTKEARERLSDLAGQLQIARKAQSEAIAEQERSKAAYEAQIIKQRESQAALVAHESAQKKDTTATEEAKESVLKLTRAGGDAVTEQNKLTKATTDQTVAFDGSKEALKLSAAGLAEIAKRTAETKKAAEEAADPIHQLNEGLKKLGSGEEFENAELITKIANVTKALHDMEIQAGRAETAVRKLGEIQ